MPLHLCGVLSTLKMSLHPAFVAGPGLFRSEKPHAGSRGRSSLAHFRVKGATLKALKKLKVCLQPSAAKEGLPIFHVPCTDLNPSLNFCAKVVHHSCLRLTGPNCAVSRIAAKLC